MYGLFDRDVKKKDCECCGGVRSCGGEKSISRDSSWSRRCCENAVLGDPTGAGSPGWWNLKIDTATQFLHRCSDGFFFIENGGAGDQHIRPRLERREGRFGHRRRRRFRGRSLSLAHRSFGVLAESSAAHLNKLLPAETGIHGHRGL